MQTKHPTHTAYLARRLAVFMSGGMNPSRVWEILSTDTEVGAVAAAVSERSRVGESVPQVLAQLGFAPIAAVWQVAEISGAPMAEALHRIAEQADAAADAARKRQVAFAGPKATMRLVLVLPLLGLGFSMLLGLNPLGVLFGSVLGYLITVAGLGLIWVAKIWSTRLMRRAAGEPHLPGYALELIAVALTGGSSVVQAKLNAADALDQYAVSGAQMSEIRLPNGAVSSAISLAEAAGIPATDMLRSEAEIARREYVAKLSERVEKLQVSLMLPLGVCVLPAFVLLSVVPMLLSLFRQSMFS